MWSVTPSAIISGWASRSYTRTYPSVSIRLGGHSRECLSILSSVRLNLSYMWMSTRSLGS
eukprot:8242230-Heterocapsa_arctica.AAC.1